MSARFRALARLIRRIAGMPDYEAHVEHLRAAHPGCPIPSRREYYDAFLQTRYQNGPSRCC